MSPRDAAAPSPVEEKSGEEMEEAEKGVAKMTPSSGLKRSRYMRQFGTNLLLPQAPRDSRNWVGGREGEPGGLPNPESSKFVPNLRKLTHVPRAL